MKKDFSSTIVFKTSIILHIATLRGLPNNPLQQVNRSTICLGITQFNPTQLKITCHKALATSQWIRRWSTCFPLLHMQHQSVTMTCRFLMLFTMRIFPKMADQAKKADLKGTLVCQILFLREGSAIIRDKDVVESPNPC